MKSEDYMKGWRDGIKEARERGDKKFEKFIKRLKNKFKNEHNAKEYFEEIDKLAGDLK